ncbi:unnamed protein product [Gordionus sp. m RMFG-2023]|uniref:RNA-binding protein 7-like n=1 Tax=Gordionus sp. m RMFG-2023 TaxID=3053472 RepID=UPI0030E07AB0
MSDDLNYSLFCGNISEDTTEELLYELFLQAGPVENVKIATERDGKRKQYAFIKFCHEISVPYAIDLMNGIKLNNNVLTLKCRKGSAHENNDLFGLENLKYSQYDIEAANKLRCMKYQNLFENILIEDTKSLAEDESPARKPEYINDLRQNLNIIKSKNHIDTKSILPLPTPSSILNMNAPYNSQQYNNYSGPYSNNMNYFDPINYNNYYQQNSMYQQPYISDPFINQNYLMNQSYSYQTPNNRSSKYYNNIHGSAPNHQSQSDGYNNYGDFDDKRYNSHSSHSSKGRRSREYDSPYDRNNKNHKNRYDRETDDNYRKEKISNRR